MEPKPTYDCPNDSSLTEMLGNQLEKSTATIDELVARVRRDKAEAEAARAVIDAQAEELAKITARYQAVLGENVQLARALAEHDGHSEPPVVGEGLRTSGMKVVLTERFGYRLANYWPEYQVWFESWTMFQLNTDVVKWWELPGGER